MSTDPRDRPADLRPDTELNDPEDVDRTDTPEPVLAAGVDERDAPLEAAGVTLPGDATGPAPDEPLASAIDGASRPDKVAIGLMAGVVVLLLICVAFGFAAR